MNNKFSDLECTYVFCVETRINGDFNNTNFRIFMQDFLNCSLLISDNLQYFRQIQCGEGTCLSQTDVL
jgi:hypothetical protein